MYYNYAHNIGFSVRKDHHGFWSNSRKIKSKDFVCSNAGFKKGIDLNSNLKYRRDNTRTGCPAMVRFSVSQGSLEGS
ncbi:Protein FAR1-RELATED SEQUENCE 6 [Dendrobium catenatum]|uniref:Protein FAR1-RELATED SEQUENCE 6 n=1 Tax=Dendrobium catenatum TaxID=906689 RepID=A0A2I0WQY7_9ASPA|nr:Protein FAR1-RELATED SEQUENCE 6 [Dendrobium catenatum]